MGKGDEGDEPIQLDFSWVKGLFKGANVQSLAMWALLIVAMGFVLWVRLLPAQLPITEDWAQQTIESNLRNQVMQQVTQQYPNLPQANRDALAEQQMREFMAQNADQIDLAREQLSAQIKERMQYQGADGEQYTYLGDLDSYYWLRYTRNWLRTGVACDAVVDGQCRDTHILAPVGSPMSFNPSLHVFAIGYFYKAATILNPDYPLPAASFMTSVLLGVLGVIPAFFIGRRLAGNVGGFVAALVILLHPLILSRSIGSDNDPWHAILPLLAAWMVIEALDAKTSRRKALFAALGGISIATYGAAWDAWWFIYLILLLGLVGNLAFRAVRASIRMKDWKVWDDAQVQQAALVVGIFYIATFVVALLTTSTGLAYFEIPKWAFSGSTNLDRAIADSYWPNVLTTVAELNQSDLSGAMAQLGGKLFFFAGLLGILLMVLPRRGWHWQHYALLAAGALISLWLVNDPPASKFVVLLLILLPVAIALLLYLFRSYEATVGDALIILVWFLATVYATYSGVRFILFLALAFGIALGVTIGRAYEWLVEYLSKEFKWKRKIVALAAFVLVLIVLMQPVKAGYHTARGFVPTIDDGWWEALTKIKEESQPDAIINSWWDFGHWFKYVAERRATADGTTQGSHVPRWLGLALVTPDERESIGILRMLDCGSDATPNPEGSAGAYMKIIRHTNDVLTTQQMVVDLVNLDKEEARDYLDERGIPQESIPDILNSTHCDPPEDYFITSGDMVGKAGVWAHFGLWDFEKAYLVQVARGMPQERAVADLMDRFGWSREEAQRRYFEVLSLPDEGAVNAYVSPWPNYYTGDWVGCQDLADGSGLVCPLQLAVSQQGTNVIAIDAIIYNATRGDALIVFGAYQNGQRLQQSASRPDLLLVAGESLERVEGNESNGIGIVMDTVEKRVLVAEPHLAQSMFTQLFYLDGRYAEYYEKFDDRPTLSGQRIITWKVDWSGADASG